MPANTPSSDQHEQRPAPARRLVGVAVGVGVLVVVAGPAYWTGVFALAGFTGCFIECTGPEPLIGALWAGITLLLLAIPVAAGLLAARVESRRPVLLAALAVVLIAAWAIAQRVM
jgi:hypothetical protein